MCRSDPHLQAQHAEEVASIRLVHTGDLAELETIIERLNRRLEAVACSDQADRGPGVPKISAAGDLE